MPAEPSWWYADGPTAISRLLRPVARLWGAATERRIERATPSQASLPVICVGNFTAGGTGKTPFSLHLAKMLRDRGERPAFLTRGYRGRHAGPRTVDFAVDTVDDVGDEALLLARAAPTIVSRNRALGAATIANFSGLSPPTVIVMDDGLQNPGLRKDLSIAVVDGRRGFGNGEVIPSGPLRATLAFQLGLVDAIVLNRPSGNDGFQADTIARDLRQRFQGPVLQATVQPCTDTANLTGVRVLALAGIANPARFHATLATLGADIVERISFPDHHGFSDADAARVIPRAKALNARIVTTEKDWVRLIGRSGACAELRELAYALPIEMHINQSDTAQLVALIDTAITKRRKLTGPG